MSTSLRRKRANGMIWGLLALVMVGLGGYGVTNFSRGLTELGQVGDRPITVNEYARTMRREIEAFSAQIGQPVSFEQAQAFGIDRTVQAQLVAAATLENEVARLGISVGDATVRDRIMEAPALQGIDGKFDRDIYSQFLRQQGLSEAEFEKTLRDEAARTLLQGAVLGGVTAPDTLADRLTAWAAETRDFTFAELIASDLATPVPAPGEDQLKAWHDAHTDAYMRPETRKITYVWLSPDTLIDAVEVDEDALKAAYEERKSDFLIPERRLVARLVYPTADEAAAARARLDAGEASFADLVAERGLSVEDVDLGEQSREDLGAAADAVFALTEPGVAGPLDSDLGPALFAMNGVLEAQETSFEEAREELRSEVAMDRARRQIADRSEGIEDLLAGGATLEEIAGEQGLTLGTVDYSTESEGGLAAYEPFRKAAEEVTAESFPTLLGLDDGGIFAIRLDGIEAAAVRPLDEVRDRVVADWTAEETHKALLALAQEHMAQIENGVTLEGLGLVTTAHDDYERGGFVADAPAAIGAQVFEMAAGDSRVIDAEGRVFLVTLTAVTPADLADPETAAERDRIRENLSQSMGRDIFEQFTRALQADVGIALDPQAIAAVNAQLR
jgi:peptidyl-prolyl cis-trans isomerase D